MLRSCLGDRDRLGRFVALRTAVLLATVQRDDLLRRADHDGVLEAALLFGDISPEEPG